MNFRERIVTGPLSAMVSLFGCWVSVLVRAVSSRVGVCGCVGKGESEEERWWEGREGTGDRERAEPLRATRSPRPGLPPSISTPNQSWPSHSIDRTGLPTKHAWGQKGHFVVASPVRSVRLLPPPPRPSRAARQTLLLLLVGYRETLTQPRTPVAPQVASLMHATNGEAGTIAGPPPLASNTDDAALILLCWGRLRGV